jgi:hypothetical protein
VPRPDLREVLLAAAVAGTVSGAPSTVLALATGRSPLEAARAAGALLGKESILRGGVAHVAITLWWVAVLAAVLPRGREVPGGVAAAVGIHGLDMGVIGRRIGPIADLPQLPQLLDHLAFGAATGATLAWSRAQEGAR